MALLLALAAGAAATLLLQRRGKPGAGDDASHPATALRAARVVTTASPNPAWAPGTPSHPPCGPERTTIMPDTTPPSILYPLMISAVVPRPIALVSSRGSDGSSNLAPFSYFGLACHDPPHVVIGTCSTSGRANRQKDTQQNILETKEFVVNTVSEWMLEAANHTCGFYDRGVNEMQLAGLTPQQSVAVTPPRVAESAVQLECVLAASHPVTRDGVVTATILIGRVVAVHVLDGVTTTSGGGGPIVLFDKLAAVSRLGGDTYARVTETYDLPRPGKEWQERRRAVLPQGEEGG